MNSENEPSVFHVRSNQAVISTGYRLFMGQFKTIFRHTCPFAIVYALAFALTLNIFLYQMPQLLEAAMLARRGVGSAGLSDVHALSLFYMLVMTVVVILLLAPVFQCLQQHQHSGVTAPPAKWYKVSAWPMTLRLLRLTLWFVLLEFIVILVIVLISMMGGMLLAVAGMGQGSVIAITLALGVLLLVCLAFQLPLVYTSYKYLLTPDAVFFKTLKSTYGVGLRHWGSLFLVVLMVFIITSLISMVVMMPYNILTAAISWSLMGVANGDPVGMPGYISWMSFIVFSVAGFVMAYINISSLFPFYYLYGSIEKQEQERKEMMHNRNLTAI